MTNEFTATNEAAPLDPDEHIAIVGMAGRFPGAADIAEFWRLCVDGADRVSTWHVPPDSGRVGASGLLADIDRFDPAPFDMTPTEATTMDPQHRIFLELCWHALESAAVIPGDDELIVSVYASAAPSTYRLAESADPGVDERYLRMLASGADFLATRVSHLLDLRGEAVSVQTACSSSLVAVHLAAQQVRAGLSDVAIAGGISVDVDQDLGYPRHDWMITSPDGRCRPFDTSANGTVHGNGGGVVVLQRLGDALAQGRRVHAVLRATATNNDGRTKASFMAPSVRGQSEVIAKALAAVPAESIGYFEAHGTGTRTDDHIEIDAARRAYARHTQATGFCALGSLKSNYGHLGRAAGIAGLIKAICAVRDGIRPPLSGFREPNPDIDLVRSPFRIPLAAEPWPDSPRRAAVSSFGVGGTNAHAIVEQYVQDPARPADSPAVLPMSAADAPALRRTADALAERLDRDSGLALAEVAHTLAAGRYAHSGARSAVAVPCRAQAAAALRGMTAMAPAAAGGLVFVFPGQTGGDDDFTGIYRAIRVFRAEIDACAAALDIDPALLLSRAVDAMPPYQPALVAVEIACAKVLIAAGIQAHALLGSSLGEYAAAHLAGVFEREPLMWLLDTRDRLMRRCEPGALLSVAAGADAVADLLGPNLVLAVNAAEDRIVLSGRPESMENAHRELGERGIRSRLLPGDIAFHSPLVATAAAEYEKAVRSARPAPATAPIASTLTGAVPDADAWSDAEYWSRQLAEPVRFADALRATTARGNRRFVELGPGTALAALILRGSQGEPVSAVSIGGHADGPFAGMATALGRIWAEGTPVDWDAVNCTGDQRFAELVGYPFANDRFWGHVPEAGGSGLAEPV
ncbi:type I polyketide synthase [Saccharopolyspora sp. K220]|uniref:type I polyketide synthase n=1 Tax=Saccharopolyspora soli TaxID=2926618 RepID=UPI001F563912|nr:type I polyketide synthase [Saccharopolyspora soli]MCI2419930.1 type I polyketide synthase [Saccharopolyspora soli]